MNAIDAEEHIRRLANLYSKHVDISKVVSQWRLMRHDPVIKGTVFSLFLAPTPVLSLFRRKAFSEKTVHFYSGRI